jgi:hypothetical protein
MRWVYNFTEEAKKLLRKQRWTWEENIKVDVAEICCEAGKWMELAQGRVQWRV